jgi:hypothetical protein
LTATIILTADLETTRCAAAAAMILSEEAFGARIFLPDGHAIYRVNYLAARTIASLADGIARA